MANPLRTNGNTSSFLNYVNSIPNPEQILKNNPLLQSSGDPKKMVYQMAQKKGISMDEINAVYNSLTHPRSHN